jgi:hypothetical protein
MRWQDNYLYVRQELQKQFSEKHQVGMKFLKVPNGPSFVNLLSLSEIYNGSVIMHDLQVQIKMAIENFLLSKLPPETI